MLNIAPLPGLILRKIEPHGYLLGYMNTQLRLKLKLIGFIHSLVRPIEDVYTVGTRPGADPDRFTPVHVYRSGIQILLFNS